MRKSAHIPPAVFCGLVVCGLYCAPLPKAIAYTVGPAFTVGEKNCTTCTTTVTSPDGTVTTTTVVSTNSSTLKVGPYATATGPQIKETGEAVKVVAVPVVEAISPLGKIKKFIGFVTKWLSPKVPAPKLSSSGDTLIDLWSVAYNTDGSVDLTPNIPIDTPGDYPLVDSMEALFDFSTLDSGDSLLGMRFDATVYGTTGNSEMGSSGLYSLDASDISQIPPCPVPAPLPLLGVGAAFDYSRRLRKRIKTSKKLEIISAID